MAITQAAGSTSMVDIENGETPSSTLTPIATAPNSKPAAAPAATDPPRPMRRTPNSDKPTTSRVASNSAQCSDLDVSYEVCGSDAAPSSSSEPITVPMAAQSRP